MKSMNQDSNPVLVFIRGMPGSGKSYLAKSLENSLGKANVMMLDPDHIDFSDPAYINFSKSLTAEGLDAKIHPFRWLRTTAYDGIKTRKVIIWNQPFTDEGIFERLIIHLQNYAAEQQIKLQVLLAEVEIDPAIAKDRVTKRIQAGGHGPSDQTLDNRINNYESYANKGYKTVTVDGNADASASVVKITEVLDELRKAV